MVVYGVHEKSHSNINNICGDITVLILWLSDNHKIEEVLEMRRTSRKCWTKWESLSMKEDYILVLFERHKYVLWESLKKKVKKKCKNCSAL